MRTLTVVSVAAAVALALTCTASADISIRWSSSSGAYNHGTSWAAGPWPDFTGLRQLIWSSDDPSGHLANGFTPNYLDAGGTEYLLTTYSAGSEDYSQWLGFNAGLYSNTHVGGNDVTNGYVFSRIFQDPTPNVGDWYYQSPAIGPDLTQYNPSDPGSVIDVDSTPGGAPIELDTQVVPEPATWAFLGLGALVVLLRRKTRA